jgi:hypothetical protein
LVTFEGTWIIPAVINWCFDCKITWCKVPPLPARPRAVTTSASSAGGRSAAEAATLAPLLLAAAAVPNHSLSNDAAAAAADAADAAADADDEDLLDVARLSPASSCSRTGGLSLPGGVSQVGCMDDTGRVRSRLLTLS